MKKQEYMKPAVRVVQVQQKYHLLVVSGGDKVYNTTKSGQYQMSRQGDDWDDDEEELF
jgi:hypothetical protein